MLGKIRGVHLWGVLILLSHTTTWAASSTPPAKGVHELFFRASCAVLKAHGDGGSAVPPGMSNASCGEAGKFASDWPVLSFNPDLTDTAVLVWDVPAGSPPYVAVSPLFLEKLGVHETLALFAHELAHHVLGHSAIRRNLDGVTASLGYMKFVLDTQELEADMLAAKAIRSEGLDLCVIQQSLNATIVKTVGHIPFELEQRNEAVCKASAPV